VLVYLYLFVVLRIFISLSFSLLVCGATVEKFTKSTKLSVVSSEYVFLFQLRSSSGIRCPTFPDQYTVSKGVQQSHNVPYAIRTETSTVRCESQKNFVLFIYIMSRVFCGTQNVLRLGETYLVKG